MHRHAESSTCGIDHNGQAEWHMRHAPHVTRSDLLSVDCWMPHSDYPQRLWDWLREHDPIAVTIPHHTMRGKTPTFWDDVDEDYQPVAEIFQDHRGSAEWLGAPPPPST